MQHRAPVERRSSPFQESVLLLYRNVWLSSNRQLHKLGLVFYSQKSAIGWLNGERFNNQQLGNFAVSAGVRSGSGGHADRIRNGPRHYRPYSCGYTSCKNWPSSSITAVSLKPVQFSILVMLRPRMLVPLRCRPQINTPASVVVSLLNVHFGCRAFTELRISTIIRGFLDNAVFSMPEPRLAGA